MSTNYADKGEKMTVEDELQIHAIGCIPVAAHPDHPPDQEDCVIEECPKCKQKMWVSIRKRKMRERKQYICQCIDCIVLEVIAEGVDPDDIKFVEIKDINESDVCSDGAQLSVDFMIMCPNEKIEKE